ncbi:hypothetical protein TYM08_P3226 [Marinicellulosiphila megalodicopiae]
MLLSVSLLLSRARHSHVYYCLAAFIFLNGFITAGPVFSTFVPAQQTYFIALTLPALLCLGPFSWMYCQGLTSQTKWRFKLGHLLHFIPAGLGGLAAICMFLFSLETQHNLLIGEVDDDLLMSIEGNLSALGGLAIFVFVLLIFWLAQSGVYWLKSMKRLYQYQNQLKHLFASNSKKELTWLIILTITIGLIWCLMCLNFLADAIFEITLINLLSFKLMSLGFIWSISMWGLRQKPGFEGLYNSEKIQQELALNESVGNNETTNTKYKNSALTQQDFERIANKINTLFQESKVYLDHDISLMSLSQATNISTHNISQTLNAYLDINFCDYINSWRIQLAKSMLIEKKLTVLDISEACGFNARSSFYKAFKKETSMTPSEYRKSKSSDCY